MTSTFKSTFAVLGLLAGLALAPQAVQAQAEVATAAVVDGTVFVTRADGRQVLLARGSQLAVGDAINTTRNSTVRLHFTDGGETVIRPESMLVVQGYQFQKEAPANDNMLLNLVKGGMRALTGAIGKRGDVNAYQLKANTATVGIRGTDFSVRLCQQDCNEAQTGVQRNSTAPVAARAVQVRGSAKVTHAGAAPVALEEGQPLYSSDEIQTQQESHVVLVFNDGARITVNPTSKMGISEYVSDAQPNAAGIGSMVIDLFKGGLRVATGLIGKAHPESVKVRTATATVGIRGTVFDLVGAPSSSPDNASPADMGDMPGDQSLFAQSREGIITLTGTQGAPLVLHPGQSGRVNGLNIPARALEFAPSYFQNIRTPAPETVPVNMDVLFGAKTAPDTSNGVLLSVHEGRVTLAQAQREVLLDAGESAFAGRALEPVRLQVPPRVLDRDPFLSSSMFKANTCRR